MSVSGKLADANGLRSCLLTISEDPASTSPFTSTTSTAEPALCHFDMD
jgi:hypothetical protein